MESSPMRYVAACALGIVWLTTAGAAEIYCNAQGRDCRDRPSGSANIARTVTAAQAAAATSTSGGVATSTSNSGGDPVEAAQQQRDAVENARATVQKDVASKRAEQCKRAQDLYQRTIAADVIYQTDKDGSKKQMTTAEVDQTRLKARMDMQQFCTPAGS